MDRPAPAENLTIAAINPNSFYFTFTKPLGPDYVAGTTFVNAETGVTTSPRSVNQFGPIGISPNYFILPSTYNTAVLYLEYKNKQSRRRIITAQTKGSLSK